MADAVKCPKCGEPCLDAAPCSCCIRKSNVVDQVDEQLVQLRSALMEIKHRLDSEFPPDYEYDNNKIDLVKRDRDRLRTMRYWLQGRVKAALREGGR
jgi:hypothetical protein